MKKTWSVLLAVSGMAISLGLYISWLEKSFPHVPNEQCQGEIQPGPVEPIPRIEDHVAAVMAAECPSCPECPTYNTLKRAGVEIVCTNAFGAVPSVNYYAVENEMACNRVKKIVVTDKRIEVERR